MSDRQPLIVGNWKMNGLGADVAQACEVAEALRAGPAPARVAICAPATLIERLARAVEGSPLLIGGEDVHPEAHGAFTGDISAAMLADAGADLVIVGHSERRHGHGETSGLVARKALAAHSAGLEPIICVGETLTERDGGRALQVVCAQARESIPDGLAPGSFHLAYEPVWAIGADQPPEPGQIAEIHEGLRDGLLQRFGASGEEVRILYGGSVTSSNVTAILEVDGVGGLLVGRMSETAASFLAVIESARRLHGAG